MTETPPSRPSPPAWIKPASEYGPLIAFFAAYVAADLMVATAVLMATTAVGVGLLYVAARRVPVMPLVTAAVVGVFGALTLWLDDETFIKMKPTIVTVLFAAVLVWGLMTGRMLLKHVLGAALPMREEGWLRLTRRFAGFFLAMALLNELVWRTQSTDFWVTFKVFGILILSVGFTLSQAPLINRYKLEDPGEGSGK